MEFHAAGLSSIDAPAARCRFDDKNRLVNREVNKVMRRAGRREFIGAAGASAAIALVGASGRASAAARSVEAVDAAGEFDPWIELDLAALASNVAQVRKRVGRRPIMAVVKCNAYGHGDVEIASALQKRSDIRHFMVVQVREAVRLRQHALEGMILNAGPFSTSQIPLLLEHGISQAVYTDAVLQLSEAARTRGVTAKVHIYVDTGMGRVGVPHHVAADYIARVAALPAIEIEGTFTDMTEDDDFNPVQIKRFEAVCAEVQRRGIATGIRHAASSAEVDRYPDAWLDMVRPGSCLVGLEPSKQKNLDIRCVMTFKARVAYVKSLQPGDSISYHRAYKIERPTRIATLACGYSDGYPPVVSGRSEVLIGGRRHPVVAPITANHIMVDVTSAPDVQIGDEVVLWGRQGAASVSMSELEALAPQATNAYRMAVRTRTYLRRRASG